MSAQTSRVYWVPPLMVGASASVVTEVAAALLLYAGTGLVRSLTVLLAVAGGSLALGLWSAPSRLDAIARRWMLSLFAFLAAAVYGGAWSLVESVGDTRWGQAAGLVLLVGFPLFAAGNVLGGVASMGDAPPARWVRPAGGAGGAGRSPGARVGAAAALGAGLGVVLTGALLPRTPLPASVLLSCLVMLSLGGVVFGVVSAGHTEVELQEERPSPLGPVRVEERTPAAAETSFRVLTEAGYERRSLPSKGEGPVTWEVAVARALMPDSGQAWRVLAVGCGASPVARAILREHPLAEIEVLERSEEVVELGARHFGTELTVGTAPRISVRAGNVEDLLKSLPERYDVVILDSRLLAPVGGGAGLSREARGRLVQAVDREGVLAWGPAPPEPGVTALASAWTRTELSAEGSAGAAGADAASTPESAERIVLLTRRDPSWSEHLEVERFTASNGSAPGP